MDKPTGPTTSDAYRSLPSVDRLLADTRLAPLLHTSHAVTVGLIREALAAARVAIASGVTLPTFEDLVSQVVARWEARFSPTLRPVINATGVILHTNLGRALLADDAVAAMVAAVTAYSTLEYELEAGERSSRYRHTGDLLTRLTGAEAALVVNNNAAAVTLVLAALLRDRDVIVSRGELVEIGGGFRVPDILAQSGARLVEVGTTNRTYVHDYERAVSERTGALLRVHSSNFRVVGFTHAPAMAELADLAHRSGLLLIDDLGSGALLDTGPYGLEREPMVQDSVLNGVDLVCFSGDKLLGGPQAGIIVGKRDAIARIERHPLTRALRVDKMTLAALDATLRHYVIGDVPATVPVWQMLAVSHNQLMQRAEGWAARLAQRGLQATTVDGLSTIGGGSLPGETLPTRLLQLPADHVSAHACARALRRQEAAVVARVLHEHVVCDPRTVLPSQDAALLDAVVDACR